MLAHAVTRADPAPTVPDATSAFQDPSDWRTAGIHWVPRDPTTSKDTPQAASNLPPDATRERDEPSPAVFAENDSEPNSSLACVLPASMPAHAASQIEPTSA